MQPLFYEKGGVGVKAIPYIMRLNEGTYYLTSLNFSAIIANVLKRKHKIIEKVVLKKLCKCNYLDIVYKDNKYFICHRSTHLIVTTLADFQSLKRYLSYNIAIYGSFRAFERRINDDCLKQYVMLCQCGLWSDFDGILKYTSKEIKNYLFNSLILNAISNNEYKFLTV